MQARSSIILVEDDPADVFMFRKVLEPRLTNGLHCETRAAHVSDAIEDKRPDFLVTDLKLPGADGVSVVQSVRRGQEWRNLPVIVCSTSSDPGDVERAYNAGANAYVRKPADLEGWSKLADCLIYFWGQLNLRPA